MDIQKFLKSRHLTPTWTQWLLGTALAYIFAPLPLVVLVVLKSDTGPLDAVTDVHVLAAASLILPFHMALGVIGAYVFNRWGPGLSGRLLVGYGAVIGGVFVPAVVKGMPDLERLGPSFIVFAVCGALAGAVGWWVLRPRGVPD